MSGSDSSVLGREELVGIGNTIIKSSNSDIVRLQLRHTSRSVNRIANNRVITSDSGDSLEISVVSQVGRRMPVSMKLSRVDEASIRSAVEVLNRLAKVQVGSPNIYLRTLDGPQEYLPASLAYDSTIDAMASVGDTQVPKLIRSLRASGFRGSAFLGLVNRSTLSMQNDGLVAFSQETDSECAVSARTEDGKASGWWGQAARDWRNVNPDMIASKAIEMAKRGINSYAVEPGRRTAILSPFAMAQVLRFVSRHFNALATNEFHATAFAVQGDPNRRNKIGLRVLDPRIRITSDPTDPLGGYTPFGDMTYDGVAMPTRPMVYVNNGILSNLAYELYYGLSEGQPFSQSPWSMRFEAKAGTHLQSIDEMIANCKEGIYVNRFSDVSQVGSISGMQTGVTRDGCFLIKDGKVDRPIKNLRFTDSPFFFLNRMIAIGKPERAPFGYTPPIRDEPVYASEWPRRPMIVPPVMVSDFNFTALSDAV